MKKNAYTIMEILVVVILLGIIAGFALPNYTNYIKRANVRDMGAQLRTLHAANMIYHAQTGSYLSASSLATVNSGLNINLISNNNTFAYSRSTPQTYTASFTNTSGTTFRVTVTQIPLASNNPSCTIGTCPGL